MAVEIPFVRQSDPQYGVTEDVAPGLRRVLANNPSAFTYHGTGTYIVGRGKVAVIDPGPLLDDHVAALLAARGNREAPQANRANATPACVYL